MQQRTARGHPKSFRHPEESVNKHFEDRSQNVIVFPHQIIEIIYFRKRFTPGEVEIMLNLNNSIVKIKHQSKWSHSSIPSFGGSQALVQAFFDMWSYDSVLGKDLNCLDESA